MPTGHAAEPYAEPLTGAAGAGRGWQQTILGARPAVGTEFTRKVPGEVIERPRIVTFQLGTSVAAGNRLATVRAEDADGNIIAQSLADNTMAAGQTQWYSFFSNAPLIHFATQNRGQASLWDLFMEPGWVLRIGVDSIAAADQLTFIYITVDRYPTDDPWNPRSHPHVHGQRRQAQREAAAQLPPLG